MAYDDKVAQRLRTTLQEVPGITERKMMGGLIFMVHGHMCCGASQDGIMVRIGPEAMAAALTEAHVEPLDIGGGRTPKAFVRVRYEGIRTQRQLEKWVKRGLRFVSSLPAK